MPVFSKIRAFMANGLTGIDLVRCWVAWRILPFRCRPGLMFDYAGELTDPQRHCQIEITDEDINNMTKTLLNESLEDCSQFGLSPFCTLNEPPAVSFEPSSYLIHISIFTACSYLFIVYRPTHPSGPKICQKNQRKPRPRTRPPKSLLRRSPTLPNYSIWMTKMMMMSRR